MTKIAETLIAAVRTVNAAAGDPSVAQFAQNRLTSLVSEVDVAAELRNGIATGSIAPSDIKGTLRSELGAVGEALVAEAMDREGWVPVHQALRDGEGGIDLILFKPKSSEILVLEVKTTSQDRSSFRTSSTRDPRIRQAGSDWVSRNLHAAGVDGFDSDVTVRGAQVFAKTGQIRWFDRVDDSGRKWVPVTGSPGTTQGSGAGRGAPPEPPPDSRTKPTAKPQSSGKSPAAGTDKRGPKGSGPAPKQEREESRFSLSGSKRDSVPLSKLAPSSSGTRQADNAGRRSNPPTPPNPPPVRRGSVLPGDARIPAGDRRFA